MSLFEALGLSGETSFRVVGVEGLWCFDAFVNHPIGPEGLVCSSAIPLRIPQRCAAAGKGGPCPGLGDRARCLEAVIGFQVDGSVSTSGSPRVSWKFPSLGLGSYGRLEVFGFEGLQVVIPGAVWRF